MYLTQYESKTLSKFKMQSKANISFFGMWNDHNRQAKGLWRILIQLVWEFILLVI